MKTRCAPRQFIFARQLPHHKHHLRGLWRSPHGCTGFHIHRHHKLTVNLGTASADQLREGNTSQSFRIHLRHSTNR